MVGVLAMPCFKVVSTIASIRRSSTACQSHERLTSVSRERPWLRNTKEMLHLGNARVFISHPGGDMTHHLQAVLRTCLLQRPDHWLGQSFVEFHEACAGRFDAKRGRIGR